MNDAIVASGAAAAATIIPDRISGPINGSGLRQQTGTMQIKKTMRFIVEAIEVLLQHELMNTPIEAVTTALAAKTITSGINANGWI